MNKKVVLGLIVVVILGLAGWKVAEYFGVFAPEKNYTLSSIVAGNDAPETAGSVDWEVQEVARDLFVPWSLVWTSPTRMLVTERSGAVRVVENNELVSEPLHTFADVSTGGEEGLMGMAVDPNYAQNRYLYFSYAYDARADLAVRIVRLTDNGDALSDPMTLLEGIPAASNHAGNRLRFGPDGKLYSTTGDATDRQLAQNPDSLAGKILRLNADGSIPSDNPFPNSYVYSLGHRNGQGIDWQPGTGALFETEHGPSIFDGPAGGDEVNIIEAGANYGWPIVSHTNSRAGLVSPLLVYTPAEAPGSGVFYSGDQLPQFNGNFFYGALRGEGLMRIVLKADAPSEVASQEKMFDGQYGRIREVAQGPDGFLYFTTSNQDGRGDRQAGDDKIYRILPKN